MAEVIEQYSETLYPNELSDGLTMRQRTDVNDFINTRLIPDMEKFDSETGLSLEQAQTHLSENEWPHLPDKPHYEISRLEQLWGDFGTSHIDVSGVSMYAIGANLEKMIRMVTKEPRNSGWHLTSNRAVLNELKHLQFRLAAKWKEEHNT